MHPGLFSLSTSWKPQGHFRSLWSEVDNTFNLKKLHSCLKVFPGVSEEFCNKHGNLPIFHFHKKHRDYSLKNMTCCKRHVKNNPRFHIQHSASTFTLCQMLCLLGQYSV